MNRHASRDPQILTILGPHRLPGQHCVALDIRPLEPTLEVVQKHDAVVLVTDHSSFLCAGILGAAASSSTAGTPAGSTHSTELHVIGA